MKEEEQDNELDRVFREGLKNFLNTPTPNVWNNISTSLMEQRLYTIRRQNKWLKVGMGLMGLVIMLLSGLLYRAFFFKNTNIPEKVIYKVEQIHDTIYVPQSPKKRLDTDSKTDTKKIERVAKHDSDITYNSQNTNFKEHENDFKFINLSKEEFVTKLKFIHEKLTFRQLDTVNKSISLQNITFTSTQQAYIDSTNKPTRLSFRNPSVKLFYASEVSQVPMETNGSLAAMSIDKEKHFRAYSYGGNVNFELGSKLSIQSGLAYSYTEFEPTVNLYERPLVAEVYNGSQNFVYKTAFGIVTIPTELLAVKPNNNNSLLIEKEDKHVMKELRIPLVFNFKFFDSQKTFDKNTNKFNVYQVIGTELKLNRSQSLRVEVRELDGHNFYTTFTKLKESNTINLGLILGAGFEQKLTPKINFYFEPTIHLSTTSYSQNQLVRSYPRWWSFASGLKYAIK